MIRKLAMSAALMAASAGLAAPAMAQSPQDDARFRAAQQRLNRELATFKAEFERYQQARSPEPEDRWGDQRYDEPARNRDETRQIPDPQRDPADRERQDNRGYDPLQ